MCFERVKIICNVSFEVVVFTLLKILTIRSSRRFNKTIVYSRVYNRVKARQKDKFSNQVEKKYFNDIDIRILGLFQGQKNNL
jgi:hypothetical protein